MAGGSSLQAPKEESLRQHILMDPELLVPEISMSQAWWTDQLFSENQRRSPTRWSHLTHCLYYFHWWHLRPTVLAHPTGAACRQPSIMDQSRASDHHSHQDAGSNESHLRLGKRVAGNDQRNQDWSHLLLPVSQERIVHPADQWTRNPPARHPNIPRSEVRKLTWSPHISTMHSKGLRKMTLMKKLAGIKRGANMKILTQVYTATVKPHMEYASSAWSSAAKTNLDQLTITQNAGLRIITGGMKTTPISELERTAGLLSLGERREDKLLRQSKKMKRLPSHPLHSKFEAPTKNRVQTIWSKRFSRNTGSPHQHATNHWKCFKTMRTGNQKLQPSSYTSQASKQRTTTQMKSWGHWPWKPLVSTTWARAYTDRSAEEAAKNDGGGVFIKLPDGGSIRKSVATGQQSTNNRAEAYALLAAAQPLNQEERPPTNTVFLTDCRSILQSLQSPRGDQIFSIRQELSLPKNKTSVTLQWIPSHCCIGGNEEADRLSKMGSKLEQSAQPMSYSEAKTILRNSFRTEWQQRLDTGTEEDSIHRLDKAAQVTIFRLRTGHCQLLSHLRKLKISHSDECSCGTGPQTPNHILQFCPTFIDLRCQTWPSLVEAHRKLWGPVEALQQTADFALLTGLKI